ncbi:hypothetical protein J6590_028845 [Homalodisca vitripennis]|nr:hypothetical protein J6590_028845 [Homalodisca vitripennis]
MLYLIVAPGPEVKRSTDYVSGLFRLDLAPRMRTSVASTTQTTVSLPPTPTPTISACKKKIDKPGTGIGLLTCVECSSVGRDVEAPGKACLVIVDIR